MIRYTDNSDQHDLLLSFKSRDQIVFPQNYIITLCASDKGELEAIKLATEHVSNNLKRTDKLYMLTES